MTGVAFLGGDDLTPFDGIAIHGEILDDVVDRYTQAGVVDAALESDGHRAIGGGWQGARGQGEMIFAAADTTLRGNGRCQQNGWPRMTPPSLA